MYTSKDQVHVCNDADNLASYAATWLVRLIDRKRQDPDRNGPFVLSLSGGSTPKKMLGILAELPSGAVDWNDIVLLWGDERNVAPEHADSNFRMVKEALLDKIDIPAENVLGVPEPGGSARSAATAYEKLLKERLPVDNAAADGGSAKEKAGDKAGPSFPEIDCVLLGMGDDVHTASLFPHTKALGEKKRWVVANEVPKLETERITFTAPFINAARNVAFLIAGEGKREALAKLWHAPRDEQEFPSQLIRPENGQLWFLLDKPALGDTPLPHSVMVQMI